MRRAARIDANHVAVVEALQAVGCRVVSLAAMGKGLADLLVLNPRKRLILLEVKDGSKPPSKRKLTPDQVKFHGAWPVVVVTSAAEAVAQALAV